MSQQEKRPNDLTPFEAALAAITPRVEGFDRERLIFLAGQAAALRGAGVSPAGYSAGGTPAPRWRWAWPAAFSAMTVVAASLLVMLCTRAGPTVATAGGEPKSTARSVRSVRRAPADDGMQLANGHTAAEASVDAMPEWLVPWQSLWTTPARPVANASEMAEAAYPESDPALRAELRRHGVNFRPPREPATAAPIVVAEAPMTYYELLHRLQRNGPAGQGG